MRQMRQSFLILVVFVMIGLLVGCGGYKQNEFLGEVPSMEKDYHNKIAKKKQEIEECTDMGEAFKLHKELEKLKKERRAKIREYIAANPLTKPLPFQTLPGTGYTVQKVALSKYMGLQISLKIDKDMEDKYRSPGKRLSIFYKAVDSKGNEIQETKGAAMKFGRQVLKAGKEYELSGPWHMKKMEDFAKIIQITEEEYNKG